MAGRPDRGKASRIRPRRGTIHAVEHASRSGGRRRPASFAGHGIGVETATPARRNPSDRIHIDRIVAKRKLFICGVPALRVIDAMKKLGLVPKRAGDRAEAPDVLGMTPPGVVTPAIAVRNESGF